MVLPSFSSHESRYSPRVSRNHDRLCLRRELSYALDQARHQDRHLRGLPSVLHRRTKVRRYRGTHREILAALRGRENARREKGRLARIEDFQNGEAGSAASPFCFSVSQQHCDSRSLTCRTWTSPHSSPAAATASA